MTLTLAKAATDAAAGGVHRLVDMVVEEVSLVDRAANKREFLIVKRDTSMPSPAPQETLTEKATDGSADGAPDAGGQETSDPGADPGAEASGDDAPLAAALAALESLTAIVEVLGALTGDGDPRLTSLAEELRAAAEQILAKAKKTEPAEEPEADAEEEEEGATKAAPSPAAKAAKAPPAKDSAAAGVTVDVAATRQALARLSALAAGALPSKATKRAAPVTPATPPLAASLADLASSFRTLSDTVKDQQQRLGRVEKQFGLPNSAGPAEQVTKAEPEPVGWPLDLNRPLGRDQVDKAVSFHDV